MSETTAPATVPETATLYVLSVFLGGDASAPTGGNALGVFLDAPGLPPALRQRIAADLGFSETVFVEDAVTGRLHIHTPAVELPLAGHPLVGTSWLLDRRGARPAALLPPAGAVPTWGDGDLTWIRADPGTAPEFVVRRFDTVAEVDALDGGAEGVNTRVWAWEDEERGLVRVRVFPRAMGIDEDEATGAAALRLGTELGRPLSIRQGVGSRIEVRPAPDGLMDVGGRTVALEEREYRLPVAG
ncbi:PhzF family phenazine biosynthesis protein [Nocardiopsis suaedae]|uniref:PhzF family phenazine biosynthesis protein n=1 Tax=Nocardiopsis suaedae TaxID=3018444 RepID=A0ABT4TEJ5_9ACTN|nr:PhzF family phenazine biosynthesis protein [Nocardiopsis suaedae]MDA2803102.1 PhzF family phenazine biosynthesis protein [Nocardiopsis suaedae]